MSTFWRSAFRPANQYRPALLFVLLTATTLASAENLHSLQDILAQASLAAAATAREQGYTDPQVSARPLDSRLHLQACAAPLQTFASPGARAIGPVSIGVRCDEPQAWTLYVRLDVSTNVTLPVLTATLPRGTIIAAGDLEMVTRTLSADPAATILDPAQVIGMELTQAAPRGSALRHSQLRPPRLIERGQTVTLVAGADGVQVTMQGRAMANAAAGDRLLVTNLASGRRIEGVVSPDGSVRVP